MYIYIYICIYIGILISFIMEYIEIPYIPYLFLNMIPTFPMS